MPVYLFCCIGTENYKIKMHPACDDEGTTESITSSWLVLLNFVENIEVLNNANTSLLEILPYWDL